MVAHICDAEKDCSKNIEVITMSALTPTCPRCEYTVNPLGLEVTAPRLSWTSEGDRRAEVQSAYRIRVATEPRLLRSDRPDMWDSGYVASSQSFGLLYSGAALQSRQRYWWDVQLWNRDGVPGNPSEPAWWEMGLLSTEEWQARWIRAANADESNASPYLRRQFSLPSAVRRARLYATALGLYECWINGERVGDQLLTPGWTDYAQRVQYQTYEVTALLRAGKNAFDAILGGGWYTTPLTPAAPRGPHCYGKQPYFLAQLEMEFQDGTRVVIVTDQSWRGAQGPIRAANLYDGECYDARYEQAGWNRPGFDDTKWDEVDVSDIHVGSLIPAYGSPVVVLEEVRPVGMTEPQLGKFIFDLGQNIVGWIRLRLPEVAAPGTAIAVRHAEVLDQDGKLYVQNLRTAKQTDVYIIGDGDSTHYAPRFTVHGFRYVEVSGLPDRPDLNVVTAQVVGSAVPASSTFACSHSLVNQLHANIARSLRGNLLSVPTDCPQRDERLGWTGDANIIISSACWFFDVATFFTKWLSDVWDAQWPDGAIPNVVPDVAGLGAGVAGWGDAVVTVPWTLYQRYGDRRILEQGYPALSRWIGYLEATTENGIRRVPGYGDWLNVEEPTPIEVIDTAYVAMSADIAATIAAILGRADDRVRWRELTEDVQNAFAREFVSGDGRIHGETQTAYVLALAAGAVPTSLRQDAASHLVKNIEERGWHLSTGFLGTPLLLETLVECGHPDVAFRLLEQRSFPGWLYMVDHGGTTVWERWDGYTEERGFQDPAMNSFNHYGFGCVGDFLYRNVAGIQLHTNDEGDFTITVSPRPRGSLTWAEATYRSIVGTLSIGWRLESDNLLIDVSVPANSFATMEMPTVDPAAVTESGVVLSGAEGISRVTSSQLGVTCRIGSGSYAFSVPFKQVNEAALRAS
jgi:alpha-L-rhamnosidase